jgi:hypothetical protein
MQPADSASWSDALRGTLQRYDELLLRQVAARLCKPRSHWPVEELIDRCVATVQNPAILDRRLQDLSVPARRLFSLIAHSRQPRWAVGSLVQLVFILGENEGLAPVHELLEAGLLMPTLEGGGSAAALMRDFEHWLSRSTPRPTVFAHPMVLARALRQDLGLPECPGAVAPRARSSKPALAGVHEADGLDWLLRLALLWQQVAAGPLRRTQQGGFFKRDLDRLRGDALLIGPAHDSLLEIDDPGLLACSLALRQGLLTEADGELRAGAWPACWEDSLPTVLASLWSGLLNLDDWNTQEGWRAEPAAGNPYPSLYFFALLLLSRLSPDSWANPAALEAWLLERHPYWRAERPARGKPAARTCHLERFLLGIAYPWRLVQATRAGDNDWLVRLAPLGRWLLGFAPEPEPTVFPQSLLVQPNLEILVYRQGLTPSLVARLSRFAAWKSFGAACTLQLLPETVYRALEAGESFASISQALERHGMKPVPESVASALRTWANKRDRLQVFPAGALFEFQSAADLNEALARGLPGVRLSERLAIVANESAIDYKHFRLTATRDYGLPPEKCVEVAADGVTLSIDLARSDLLIETEVERFAEALEPGANGRRSYRMTPDSLAAAGAGGMTLAALEHWFLQRTGQQLSPSARLFLTGCQLSPWQFQRLLVFTVPTVEMADGLMQWPRTRSLIQGRLGPTALVVAEENREALEGCLRTLGMM